MKKYQFAVKYKRPRLKKMAKEGISSVDMHFHTKYSKDAGGRIKTILKLCKKRHVGVAITDHNEIKGSLEAFKKRRGIFVIPGMELTSKEGPDILVYFYNPGEMFEYFERRVKKYRNKKAPHKNTKLSVVEILDSLKGYNAISSLAHPFSYLWKNYPRYFKKYGNKEKVIKKTDAIEILCGELPKRINKKAMKWRDNLGKSFTGGSDGHNSYEVGRVVTCTYENDVEGFLNSIKKKTNMVIGKTTKINKMISYPLIFTKNMKFVGTTLKGNVALFKKK